MLALTKCFPVNIISRCDVYRIARSIRLSRSCRWTEWDAIWQTARLNHTTLYTIACVAQSNIVSLYHTVTGVSVPTREGKIWGSQAPVKPLRNSYKQPTELSNALSNGTIIEIPTPYDLAFIPKITVIFTAISLKPNYSGSCYYYYEYYTIKMTLEISDGQKLTKKVTN